MSVVPAINTQFKSLSTSPTLRINQTLNQLKSQGKQVAHFGFGQSPFPAPELLEQSLAECVKQNSYLPTQGLLSLREAIASWMKDTFSITCHADQIFVGPGTKECIFDLLFLLEGTVLIPQGSWVSYKPIAKILNKPFEIVPTSKQDRYCLNPETLVKTCQDIQGPKILILNSPNNPTGQVYDNSLLENLAKVCQQENVIVISDEIYGLVQFEDKPYASIQHFYPEGTIVTNGISKAFSAGGYRLGFAVLPENFKSIYPFYNALISETYSAVSSPIQHAALSVFSQYDKIKPYVQCCNHIHQWVLEYTYQRLITAGVEVDKPQGAFYLLGSFEPFRDALKSLHIQDGQGLCDHILNEYGVALLPSRDFGFNEEHLGFRLSPVDYSGQKVLPVFSSQEADSNIGEWFPNIKWGLDQLVNFVHSLNRK